MPDVFARRSAGVLLHPTSLPGPFGVGDLGPSAFRWIDILASMQQQWWQILPLGPTGFGDSPYQSFSTFAGNTNLISPELLVRDGLLEPNSWPQPEFSDVHFDSVKVVPFKTAILRQAWSNFGSGKAHSQDELFQKFCQRQSRWLNDYATFMAIRGALGECALADWPEDLIRREPKAISAMESELAGEIAFVKFGQYLFERQWNWIRDHAREKGIQLIGDVPIFVSPDSADVWANPGEFLVDEHCRPLVVAGVPPDYFSEDGQHWGNPLYNWSAMKATNYRWWADRIRHTLTHVDLIRLDHFRGFAQAWHIPAEEQTARNGRWVDGAGADLFHALNESLGDLPFIAEDLGLITPDVEELRVKFALPGMRVLQFAFDKPTNPYLPQNYEPRTVVYTGTHDNDTTTGWWRLLPERDRNFVRDYFGHEIHEPCGELIRAAWSSVARLAVAPLQDLLRLGSESRMNIPGKPSGNWKWRFRWEQLTPHAIDELRDFTIRYGRGNER